MLTADVVVVGGGPAGAAAAITVANSGRRVVVLDRATFPRDKACGDGLTTMALRTYERLGLEPGEVASWHDVEDFSLRSPSGRWVRLPLPRDRGLYAAVARRAELDAALLAVARRCGVEVHEGVACSAARQSGDRVQVEGTDGIRVEARYLIAADGAWSPTRKMLGAEHPDGYLGEWHAFRQYFTGVSGQASRQLTVWFEPDFLPGYAWSFPVGDGEANVGFGILRGRGGHRGYQVSDMRWLWPEILERTHVAEVLGDGARPEGPHRAWPIPARIDRARLTLGRALWVGDAAAAADPMTGEGIGQALETGIWAADAVLGAGAGRPGQARSAYERRVRWHLAPDYRMSMLLLRALSHRKGTRFPLWVVDRSDWSRRNFARWLWEDYPRAMIATPWRWHRGMFTGPGAYRDPAET